MSRHPKLYSRKQGGFSLIELVVVAAVTSLMAIPLATLAINGLIGYTFVQTQSDTSTELTILSARVGKVVRGTTGIIATGSNTLTIYGYFSPQDTVVKQIRYFVSGTNLNVGVTPPSGTAPNYTYNSSQEVVTTSRVDLALGATPMFTYYDDLGNQLPTTFSPSQVKQIGIYLAANPHSKQVNQPIAISTRITLRNFKTNL